MNDDDVVFMHKALEVAETGIGKTDFAPSIGCAIVKNGEILATARTQDGGVPHAEVTALGILAEKGISAEGATAYVTLEPCANPDLGADICCADALIAANIRRVVAATGDPDHKTNGQGFRKLQDAGIETVCGVLENESLQQNPDFYSSRGIILKS